MKDLNVETTLNEVKSNEEFDFSKQLWFVGASVVVLALLSMIANMGMQMGMKLSFFLTSLGIDLIGAIVFYFAHKLINKEIKFIKTFSIFLLGLIVIAPLNLHSFFNGSSIEKLISGIPLLIVLFVSIYYTRRTVDTYIKNETTKDNILKTIKILDVILVITLLATLIYSLIRVQEWFGIAIVLPEIIGGAWVYLTKVYRGSENELNN